MADPTRAAFLRKFFPVRTDLGIQPTANRDPPPPLAASAAAATVIRTRRACICRTIHQAATHAGTVRNVSKNVTSKRNALQRNALTFSTH
jgi:hypothetical protein